MDATHSPPSVVFALDTQATPASLHRFLRAQPGTSHVTIEFKIPQGPQGQKIPVLRVVHIGEREVFTEDSRQALVGKLRDWNDALLGQPGASEAAKMLNGIVGTSEELSLDVHELAPAVEAMGDAWAAAHPNAHLQAWRENEEEVLRIAAPEVKGANLNHIKQDRQALRYALKLLSRFDGLDDAEIDGNSLLKQAWSIAHATSPDEYGLLQTAWMCLTKHKDKLGHLVGPELLSLLALCRDAHATRLENFRADPANKETVFRLMETIRKSDGARPAPPDSPYATSLHKRAVATQPKLDSDATTKAKKHQRRGSMPALFVSREPVLSSTTEREAEKQGASRTKKAAKPSKSPRESAPSGSSGSQTVKERAKAERAPLRRIRTEIEDAPAPGDGGTPLSARGGSRDAGDKPSSSTPATDSKTEKKKRRLERSGTAKQVRREKDEDAVEDKLDRESGGKKSSGKSDKSAKTSKSGKSSKKSSKESSPEDKDKATKTLPRKARREHSGDGDLLAHDVAMPTTTEQTVSTTSLSNTGKNRKERISQRPGRRSQPTHMELQQLFASEEFKKARNELEPLPSYKPAAAVVYQPRADGTHWLEWEVYAEEHAGKITDEVFLRTQTLLSYFPELPDEVDALKKVVKDVLKSAKLKRDPMLAVLKARDLLAADNAARAQNEKLQQTHDLLSLALKLDNERRIRAGLQPLYDEAQ